LETNPYKPPAAGVADIAPVQPPVRPRGVNIALALIGAALLLKLLMQIWGLYQRDFHVGDPRSYGLGLAVGLGLFALYGLMCHQLAQGRSWPRVLLLLLTLAGFAATCYAIGAARKLGIVSELLLTPTFLLNQLLPMILNFAALHLLFFASGTWFRQQPD
jgi:hypothetical protein